jgi:Na+/H+-dicarboxylate symporter
VSVPICGKTFRRLHVLALLIGVDRFMSEIRTLTNVCGNAVAMIVIAKWERAFDDSKAGAILTRQAGADVTPADTPD